MRLRTLYKNILESLSVQMDAVGVLSHRLPDGKSIPVYVNVAGQSKRLVFPSDELLRSGLPDDTVAFHPLSEVSNRGESEVFRTLKTLVVLKLSSTLVELMVALAELAADPARSKGLPSKLLPLLEALPNADEKFVDHLSDVLGRAVSDGKNRLLNIFMSRGGQLRGQKHARVAVVSFPILEELDNEDRKVFGVQLRVKDIHQLRSLFAWVLPNSDMEHAYSECSDSVDAPYFEALMRAYYRMGTAINHAIKLAGKHIGKIPTIDLSWFSELDALDQMRFEVPPLEGNKGVSPRNEQAVEEPAKPAPAATGPAPIRQIAPAPAQTPQAPSPDSKGSRLRKMSEVMQQAAMPPQAPTYPPVAPMPMQPPAYAAPAVQTGGWGSNSPWIAGNQQAIPTPVQPGFGLRQIQPTPTNVFAEVNRMAATPQMPQQGWGGGWGWR